MKKSPFLAACILLLIYAGCDKNNEQNISLKDAPAVEVQKLPETALEPERKFYNLVRAAIPFSKNFNDIDSIYADKNYVKYYSKAGIISYCKFSDYWEIDTIPNKRLQTNGYKTVRQDKPKYFYSNYLEVADRSKKDDYEIVLMYYAGESAINSSAIVDSGRNKVFYPGNDLYKSIDFDDRNIYLGQPFGFATISRKDATIDEYAFIPCLTKKSHLYMNENRMWIAADQVGIQRINRRNLLDVTFWSYKELVNLIDSADLRNSITEDRRIKFTNFCENDSLVIIGYKIMGDYYTEWASHQGSILLLYNKDKNVWKSIYIPKIKALKLIALDGGKIWLGGNHPEFGEGDSEPLSHGGVASYDFATGKYHYYNDIPNDRMVYDFTRDGDDFIVSLYSYNEAAYKYVLKENKAILMDSVKYQFGGALRNEIENEELKKTQSDYANNIEKLKDVYITLRIVRLNKRPIELETKPYYEDF